MKHNYFRAILSLFALAMVIFGASIVANAQAQYRKALDFDGDGKADLTVLRTTSNSGNQISWYSRNSQTGALKAAQWGGGNNNLDFMCAGDFDGDGKADYCITRRNASGIVWYIMQSSGTFRAQSFGIQTDRPIPADYDGDGKADIAVWRGGVSPSGIAWYILQSSNNQLVVRNSGQDAANDNTNLCFPVPAMDIDGDGKQDIAQTCRLNNNSLLWSITRSTNGAVERYYWGLDDPNNRDILVPADYDGDGKTDVAVIRQTDAGNAYYRYTWYIRYSSNGGTQVTQFGANDYNANIGDAPVPADYDGDGKADIAVYRVAGGSPIGTPQYFYVLRSASPGSLQAIQWGVARDNALIIPTDYLSF